MAYKIITSCCAFLLFIVDSIRVRKGEPVRQEGVSLVYFLFFFIIFYNRTPPRELFSFATLGTLFAACGLTLIHASVTVFNYWFILFRWEKPIIFIIIAWTGIVCILLFNLSIIWIT